MLVRASRSSCPTLSVHLWQGHSSLTILNRFFSQTPNEEANQRLSVQMGWGGVGENATYVVMHFGPEAHLPEFPSSSELFWAAGQWKRDEKMKISHCAGTLGTKEGRTQDRRPGRRGLLAGGSRPAPPRSVAGPQAPALFLRCLHTWAQSS